MTKIGSWHLDGLVLGSGRRWEAMSGSMNASPGWLRARKRESTPLRFDVEIRIEDLGRFLRVADHAAELSGTVTFEPLGAPSHPGRGIQPLHGGPPDRNPPDDLRFRSRRRRQPYFLHGHKRSTTIRVRSMSYRT